MGQLFIASAYDIDSKTCCTFYADKFHANCYSYSAAVRAMHYLLRKNPYRIMWGGNDVIEDIMDIDSEEDLMGISTFLDYDNFDIDNLEDKSLYDKVMFIGENNKLWNYIDVEDESKEYFNIDDTFSVKYSGYLINHTKKLAVNLADYYEKSVSVIQNIEMAIDLVPVLTETGGGTLMAFDNCITYNTTEDLAGKWCGDLLQIVESLPEGYEIINCCFAESRKRSYYCYKHFGYNKDGLLLNDKNGTLYNNAMLGVFGNRGPSCNISIRKENNSTYFKPVNSDNTELESEDINIG
ncbi:MAG: hypothetical protein FWD13_07175 [Treponema sp.]|nr:hypothetical protein [Treponema sp.]